MFDYLFCGLSLLHLFYFFLYWLVVGRSRQSIVVVITIEGLKPPGELSFVGNVAENWRK